MCIHMCIYICVCVSPNGHGQSVSWVAISMASVSHPDERSPVSHVPSSRRPVEKTFQVVQKKANTDHQKERQKAARKPWNFLGT